MSIYVGEVNINALPSGMELPRIPKSTASATVEYPRLKASTGWNNYKNVKSGQYNREVCWPCSKFPGFLGQTGTYPRYISNAPPALPNEQAIQNEKAALFAYEDYRMNQHTGSCSTYLNDNVYKLYPKRYVKGNWPDEKLIYTNAPKTNPKCNNYL